MVHWVPGLTDRVERYNAILAAAVADRDDPRIVGEDPRQLFCERELNQGHDESQGAGKSGSEPSGLGRQHEPDPELHGVLQAESGLDDERRGPVAAPAFG